MAPSTSASATAGAAVPGAAAARPRLALVVSHPIQHFCPMYRELAALGSVDLLVIFAEADASPRFDPGFGRTVGWQPNLLEGFAHTFLRSPEADRPKALLATLEAFAPNAVYVHGYATPYLRAAMRWSRRRNIPVLMTTDSELLHARPLLTRIMKRIVLPRILRDVTTFLTVGDENERYFRHYGVPPSRMQRASFSIDSTFYDTALAQREQVRRDFRAKHSILPDAVVLLTVGKLIERKAQSDLLRAFAQALPSLQIPAVLLLAGDGPDRAALEPLAAPLGDAVRMLGFIGVNDLPACYIASDLYVHPSSDDPHPLAISEALYCSLPVIASDRVGSIGPTDDVQPGRNGASFPVHDIGRLAATLTEWINDAAQRAAAAAISRTLGEAHAAPHVAQLFAAAVLRSLIPQANAPR